MSTYKQAKQMWNEMNPLICKMLEHQVSPRKAIAFWTLWLAGMVILWLT